MKIIIQVFVAILLVSCSTKVTLSETAIINQPVSTIVTPVLNAPIGINENLIFCASVQLAWDQLKTDIGEDVKLVNPVSYLDDLNSTNYKDQINQENYIALYGTPENVKAAIKKQALEKFGKVLSEETLPNGGSYLLYAYLQKHLPFKEPFQTGKMQFKNHRVKSFYGNDYQMNKQAELIFYAVEEGLEGFNKGEFIIRLNTKEQKDEIIVAKIEPEETLKATFEKVNKLASKGNYTLSAYSENHGDHSSISFPIRMNEESYFELPQFNFKIDYRFPELTGNQVIQTEKSIDGALQTIRFQLDGDGAILESEFVAYDSIPAFNLPPFKVNNKFRNYSRT